MVLKQSRRLKEKIRAQTILEQLVQEKVLSFYLTALAMVHLSELLIAEVKLYGEPDVWEEVKALIDKLYVMAQDQHSFSMSVEALLLRAKFAAVDGNLSQALKYYEQAQFTATEKNLPVLLAKVDTEQTRFKTEFAKWQDKSLQETIVIMEIDDYIKEVIDKFNLDIPREPREP